MAGHGGALEWKDKDHADRQNRPRWRVVSRYYDIDPSDLDPDTGQPYSNYGSPSLDTSFHDHEMDVDDIEPSKTRAATFAIGERVNWPNGTIGPVMGIDALDDALLDECGGWHQSNDVDKL